ncbi:hypothetical protein SAMN06265365_14237 [Tistlia consotensis]|uniref:Uncharacterized protein n=1 Tax=Tistlia consotensis USBA 355 TaxID=560819 RepID=A0A1Y6CQJ0_9PROT|nr:hypothetical protein [Tistlia consotensis]SMF82148.1 hypothetical protein SAMN05428998_14537 [Tistlia consotensis USBA 355]SNS25658.1 hypothetical protein SAMN06265365_14237 [Tistlia consotensis]
MSGRPFAGRDGPDPETLERIGPLWAELHGGLWHTTHPERFLGILEKGAIQVEPELPDPERFGTLNGRKNWPFVRFIGGVSLFDFHRFDPAVYDEICPGRNWQTFVPYRSEWDWHGAIWLEIDRTRLRASAFLSAEEVRYRWFNGGDLAHRLIAWVEAAHIGDLPLSACRRALFVHPDGSELHALFEEIPLEPFDHDAYELRLVEWRRSVERLLEHNAEGGDGSLAAQVGAWHSRRDLQAFREKYRTSGKR